MTDMLALSANLPEVEFAPGEAVVHEGGASGSIWILVSGALRVRKGNIQVNTITDPGALIGEMSILQGIAHSATVEATQQSTLRHAADGHGLLASAPAYQVLANSAPPDHAASRVGRRQPTSRYQSRALRCC